jgi:UrcA family protein
MTFATRIVTRACVCSLLFAAVAAQAEAVNSVVVPYGDLNLTDSVGAKVLYSRLRKAAEQVCGPVPNLRELDRSSDYEQCRDSALHSAIRQINQPIAPLAAQKNP